MLRPPLVLSVPSGVPPGPIAPGRTSPAAQRTMPPADGQGFAGTWRLTILEDQGPPTLALGTFGADGTLLTAEHPVVTPPDSPGPVFASAGHGAWRATGPNTAILTSVGLGADGHGDPFGIVTIRASIALAADGRSLSGEFVATIADPAGTAMATIPGTLHGTPIVAEAPRIPPATA